MTAPGPQGAFPRGRRPTATTAARQRGGAPAEDIDDLMNPSSPPAQSHDAAASYPAPASSSVALLSSRQAACRGGQPCRGDGGLHEAGPPFLTCRDTVEDPATDQHAAEVVQDKLYVVGGSRNGRSLSDVQDIQVVNVTVES
ncbi:hypothetical protein ZWY2020_024786 [Hordeum vulgare]|nr:hypothetical protein ZWY2020_024786 [Hordeum vulgare]